MNALKAIKQLTMESGANPNRRRVKLLTESGDADESVQICRGLGRDEKASRRF